MSFVRNELSVAKQVLLQKTISGALCFAGGLLRLFNNMACDAIACIAYAGSIVCMIFVMLKKKEEMSDEMSEQNYAAAEASTLKNVQIILCLVGLALLLIPGFPYGLELNWHRVLVSSIFILMGIADWMTGYTFKKLEAL